MLANHTRLFSTFVCLLLLSLLLPQALAESKVQVKVLDEPLAIQAPKDSSILIEAKYVAVVKGVGVLFLRSSFKNIMLPSDDELRQFLAKQYRKTVLHYVNGQLYTWAIRGRLLGEMLDPMPPGLAQPPGWDPRWGPMPGPAGPPGVPQPVRPRPTSTGVSRSGRPAGWDPAFGPLQAQAQRASSTQPLVHEFRILAETPQRAEQLARALIGAYDDYVQSRRREVQVALKEHQTHLPKQKEVLEKGQHQYDELSQQLDAIEPIPQQVYEELKTKEWTLRVEMAGVEGRLKAAKELTSRIPGGHTVIRDNTAIKKVSEEISITSQIELAGLLEQLNKIDEFLKTYRHYAQLTAKKQSANGALNEARKRKASTERGIESLKTRLEEDLVPFELTEPVQIRPIEWTKASASEPVPGGFLPRGRR